jgi:hypothetical protein
MAKKITDLTADASPTSDDLIETVNDPGGTPASRKVTLANLWTALKSFTKVGLPVEIGIACSDESTAITTGTAKVTFRMPFAMTVNGS